MRVRVKSLCCHTQHPLPGAARLPPPRPATSPPDNFCFSFQYQQVAAPSPSRRFHLTVPLHAVGYLVFPKKTGRIEDGYFALFVCSTKKFLRNTNEMLRKMQQKNSRNIFFILRNNLFVMPGNTNKMQFFARILQCSYRSNHPKINYETLSRMLRHLPSPLATGYY